jgi:hypothetical protein
MEIDFDKMLHRPIRPGYEFDNLIPKAQNTTEQFEKSSKEILETDVFDTLNYIKQWVNLYHGQMSKIAPLLKGKNHAETAKNIYSWLYNHIQYQLDKSPLKQRLFSPAAAWHHRVSGIDCKSFSLLASCILTELKIPHSLRMVKQKGVKSLTDPSKWIVNPNYWNHVYVVIPEGSKFHIIDATTHDNREVKIVTKHDHNIMIHQGLNAAYSQKRQRNGLGCACQGTSLAQHGLGSPATMQFAISNFHKYLNELERQGVSRAVTNRILNLVRANVEAGIDPNMEEILQKATNSNQLGSIFSNVKVKLNDSVKQGVQQANSALNNISVEGVKVSDVAAAIDGDSSAIMNIATEKLKEQIPDGWFGKTFGAVFANGFKLSCFNSTVTPSQTKGWAEKDFAMVYNNTIAKGVSEKNLNDFIDAMNWVKAQSNSWAPKMNSCSRQALEQYGNSAITLKNQVLSKIKEVAVLTPKSPETVNRRLNFVFSHPNYNVYDKPYTSERFSIQEKQGSVNQNQSGNTVPGTKTPVNQNQASGTQPSNSGISPVLVLSGIGLAIKLLL